MTYKRLQVITFLIILLAAFIVVLAVLKPFFNILALAVILSILFHPFYLRLKAQVKSPSWSSFLTVLIIVLIITLPIYLFGQLVINELLDAYHKLTMAGVGETRNAILQHTPEHWRSFVETGLNDFNATLTRFTGDAFRTVSNIVSNLASFFVAFFLLLFTVFYLVRDGEHLIKVLMDISPMASSQEDVLFKKIVIAINGVVKGQFLIALIQGGVAMIGFLIFGVPQPILWGLATVLAALVPTVGTSLSVIPAVLLLFFTGHTTAAIGMAIWGAVAVGLIDNFISPRLIGARIKIHPLLVLLAVLGGIQFFGFLGFLIGPILMAIFVALLDMYRADFKGFLEQ